MRATNSPAENPTRESSNDEQEEEICCVDRFNIRNQRFLSRPELSTGPAVSKYLVHPMWLDTFRRRCRVRAETGRELPHR